MKTKFSLTTTTVAASSILALTAGAAFFLFYQSPEIPAPTPEPTDWRSQLNKDRGASASRGGFANQIPARQLKDTAVEDAITNPLLSIAEQRRRAFLLAEDDPQKARDALEQLIANGGSSAAQAALAEALGLSDDPETQALLNRLAQGENAEVARGAVRGIARRDSADAADRLADILHNIGLEDSVRTEAARRLGQMEEPSAFNHLLRASYDAVDLDDFEPVFKSVLEGLGMQDYTQTADYFARLLEHPDIDAESRIAALEALADAKGDAGSLLLRYAAHEDVEIREAASWSLAMRADVDQYGDPLIDRLHQEEDPEVRSRLYSAASAAGADSGPLWQTIMSEKDPAAFLAGATMLATQVDSSSSARFDREAVPALKQIAVESASYSDQLKAIVALGRASSPGARAALGEVYTANTDPRIHAAIDVARRQ